MIKKILSADRDGIVGWALRCCLTRGSALAMAVAVAFAPVPAFACSVTFLAPRDPAERYAGTDVRRVAGTYRIERVAAGGGTASPAWVLGLIATRQGRRLEVVQPYRQQWVDCGVYDLPLGDSEGTFYLSRRRNEGRYRLLGWTGALIPGNRIPQPDEEGDR